jgi:hypothetical protein
MEPIRQTQSPAPGGDASDAVRLAQHASYASNLLARVLVAQQKAMHELAGTAAVIADALKTQAERLTRIEALLGAAQQHAVEDSAVGEARYARLAKALDDIGRDAKLRERRATARHLAALCADAHRTFADASERDYLRYAMAGLAADLGMEAIEPEVGAAFDPRTMAPARSQPALAGNPRACVVAEVVAPGFRCDGVVLECAKVLLAPPPSPSTHPPARNGSVRCQNQGDLP